MRQAIAPLSPEIDEALAVYLLVKRNELQGLPGVVAKIANTFDGHRTIRDICQEAQISVNKGLVLVKKLSAMGVLIKVTAGEYRTEMSQLEAADTIRDLPQLGNSDFNAVEEAFFASEVQPIDECDLPFQSVGEKVSSFVSDLVVRLRGDLAF